MNVVLIRHGRTKLNRGAAGASAERIRGWVDVDLDEEGYKEADRLARRFKDRNVKEVYYSPLSRARETAARIIRDCGACHVHTPDVCLMPWQLGEMHGELVQKVISRMNYYVKNEDLTVPRGEPFRDFRVRFLTFLKRQVEKATCDTSDALILLVTHSRNVQITKAWAAAGFPSDLTINTDRMTDYSDEHGTGSELVIRCP